MPHRHFPFVVLEIEAESLERAKAFYTAVFGWSFVDSAVEAGAIEAEMGGDHDTMVRVHLRVRAALAGAPSRIDYAARRHGHSLCVRDLTLILDRVVRAGGQLVAGPTDVQGLGRRLYVLDSEHNELAILEPAQAT